MLQGKKEIEIGDRNKKTPTFKKEEEDTIIDFMLVPLPFIFSLQIKVSQKHSNNGLVNTVEFE